MGDIIGKCTRFKSEKVSVVEHDIPGGKRKETKEEAREITGNKLVQLSLRCLDDSRAGWLIRGRIQLLRVRVIG